MIDRCTGSQPFALRVTSNCLHRLDRSRAKWRSENAHSREILAFVISRTREVESDSSRSSGDSTASAAARCSACLVACNLAERAINPIMEARTELIEFDIDKLSDCHAISSCNTDCDHLESLCSRSFDQLARAIRGDK